MRVIHRKFYHFMLAFINIVCCVLFVKLCLIIVTALCAIVRVNICVRLAALMSVCLSVSASRSSLPYFTVDIILNSFLDDYFDKFFSSKY